jgi:hypothetical protein
MPQRGESSGEGTPAAAERVDSSAAVHSGLLASEDDSLRTARPSSPSSGPVPSAVAARLQLSRHRLPCNAEPSTIAPSLNTSLSYPEPRETLASDACTCEQPPHESIGVVQRQNRHASQLLRQLPQDPRDPSARNLALRSRVVPVVKRINILPYQNLSWPPRMRANHEHHERYKCPAISPPSAGSRFRHR